jgi:hypothetical protein
VTTAPKATDGGPLRLSTSLKGHTRHVLHHQVRLPALFHGEVEHLGDVGVAQAAGELGLADEALAHLGVGDELRAHDLDDADPLQQAVAHLVDGAHATLGDLLQDLVLGLDARKNAAHEKPGRSPAPVIVAASWIEGAY